jgi:hypothetical protein
MLRLCSTATRIIVARLAARAVAVEGIETLVIGSLANKITDESGERILWLKQPGQSDLHFVLVVSFQQCADLPI